MSAFNLPSPVISGNTKEDMQNLYDTVLRLRKELEYGLYNLDDSNIPGLNSVIADEIGNSTLIQQNAESISLLASDISGNTAAITVNANAISSLVTDVSGNTSSIIQNADNITSIVTDIGSIETDVSNNTSSITQNASNIALKVSQTDYNGNEIVSMINQTATTIDIAAEKINLTGFVSFSNLTDGSTSISGDNIDTGTIDADRVATDISQVNELLYIGEYSSTDTKEIRFASGSRLTGGNTGVLPWFEISSYSLDIDTQDVINIGHNGTISSTVTCKGDWDFSDADITGMSIQAVWG